MPVQTSAELEQAVGPINIADIKKLGIPEGSTPAESHNAITGALVNEDCIRTLPRLWEGLNKEGVPDFSVLPDSISQTLAADVQAAGGFEQLAAQYQFSLQEAALISQECLKNAVYFEQQGDKVRAVEARRIPAIFVEFNVLISLRDNAWGFQEYHGSKIAVWRIKYTKGMASDLLGYKDYSTAVDGLDMRKQTERTVSSFDNLRKLGISSYSELFTRMGMDPVALEKQVDAAKADFTAMREDLDAKIQELVSQGKIPDVDEVKKSYAAYALAATELDKQRQKQEAADPDQILDELAQQENIPVNSEALKINTDSPLPTASAFLLGWKGRIGVALFLPENPKGRQAIHEATHGLTALLIGNEYRSPLLAVQLPRVQAELIATYAANKYGGPDSYFARLETIRFALLNQAQYSRMNELDNACSEENIEAVEAILKADLTSEAIKQTFGSAVKGEGMGLSPGSFGLFGASNAAGLEYARNNTPMREVIEKTVFS